MRIRDCGSYSPDRYENSVFFIFISTNDIKSNPWELVNSYGIIQCWLIVKKVMLKYAFNYLSLFLP